MLLPVVRRDNEPDPIAILFAPVAELLNAVVAPIETFVETLPLPRPICKLLIEPVTPNDPVI